MKRRPPTDIDQALSDAINSLRVASGLSVKAAGAAAGLGKDNSQRLFGAGTAGQAWTVGELVAYGAAFGVSPLTILVAAGLATFDMPLDERIIGEPWLSPADKATLLRILTLMARNQPDGPQVRDLFPGQSTVLVETVVPHREESS